MTHAVQPSPPGRDPVHLVALGDSQAEGIGDPLDVRARRHGGFVNRLVDAWRAVPGVDFAFTNLSVAGARMQDLVDEQLAPALATRADLALVVAGVNDARKDTPAELLAGAYDRLLTDILATGATVVTSRLPDLVSHVNLLSASRKAVLSRRLREVRSTMDEVLDEHRGAMADGRLLDLVLDDVTIERAQFSVDQLHLNGSGHAGYGQRVADLLGAHGWRHVTVPVPTPQPLDTLAHLGWLARRYGPRVARGMVARTPLAGR